MLRSTLRLLPTTRRFAAALSTTSAAAPVDTPAQIKRRFLQRLEKEQDAALLGGGQKRIDNQHKKGKLTATRNKAVG